MSETITMPGFRNTSLVIRIRVTRRARLRLWLGTHLIGIAAWVIGCGCAIVLDPSDPNSPLTDDGLPRALSVSERYKGYHRDAAVTGYNLVVRLDGVEQSDVIAYDIDAGIVTTYARNAGCNLRQVRMGEEAMDDFVVWRRKGVVTVERKA